MLQARAGQLQRNGQEQKLKLIKMHQVDMRASSQCRALLGRSWLAVAASCMICAFAPLQAPARHLPTLCPSFKDWLGEVARWHMLRIICSAHLQLAQSSLLQEPSGQ